MFLIEHIIFSQFGGLQGPQVKRASPGEGNGSGLLVQWLSVRQAYKGLLQHCVPSLAGLQNKGFSHSLRAGSRALLNTLAPPHLTFF